MKSIQSRRNLTIILATVSVLIAFYILYIQVYTKSRENSLIETRFRVLDQMGMNLKAKMDSYVNNAATYNKEVYSSAQVARNLSRSRESLNKKLTLSQSKYRTIEKSIESVVPNQAQLTQTHRDLYKVIEDIQNQEKEIRITQDSLNKLIQLTVRKYSKVYNDDLVFVNLNNKVMAPVDVRHDSVIVASDSLEFYLPADYLMKNIQRQDVFSESLVIADSSIIYCSFSGDLKLAFLNSALEGKAGNRFSLLNSDRQDTLFLPVGGKLLAATIQSNRYYEVRLSDGTYKLFLKPVKIKGMDWFIGGLVSKKEFQRETQSIAPWLIILLSLAFVMIMLSLPFIKLRLISSTELLGKSTIFHIALSLLLGISFFIFYIFFQANYLYRIADSDAKLKSFATEINQTFDKELRDVYSLVDTVDRQAAREITGKQVLNDTNILMNGRWDVKLYPYFDYIFWLDSNGNQTAQISPFTKKEKFLNLSTRNYFRNKDGWFWPYHTKDKPEKFMMESIVSVKSGDYKVAFSRISEWKKKVVVLTGRFYSLIDPIIPKGYSFCIIDKSGRVWFHSNKYQNLSENFVEECDEDRGLRAALYSDVSRNLNVSYYNNPYKIYIQRMRDVPLYLVTMHDLRYEYSFQAQTFVTTLILTTTLFLYFFLQLVLLLVLKRIFKKGPGGKGSFQVEFSKFRPGKVEDYQYLILIILLSTVVLNIFIFHMPPPMALISIFMTSTALLTILFYHLQDYNYKSPAIAIYFTINGIIITALMILLIVSYNLDPHHPDTIYAWVFLVVLLVTIALSVPRSGKYFSRNKRKLMESKGFPNAKFQKLLKKLDITPVISYSFLIFLLSLSFGVIPIIKFFNISVNLENEVHIRYSQLELSRQRDVRNQNYEKYYERIVNQDNTNVREVHKKRLDKGIYATFWFNTRMLDSTAYDPSDYRISLGKFDSLLIPFRPIYVDQFSQATKFLFLDESPNRDYYWYITNDSTADSKVKSKMAVNHLKFIYDSPSEDVTKSHIVQNRVIVSDLPEIHVLTPFSNSRHHVVKDVLFYILIVAMLVLIFRLILVTTRRLFGVSLIPKQGPVNVIALVKEQFKSGEPVLLVNPSGLLGFQGLFKKVRDEVKALDFNWEKTDYGKQPRVRIVSDLFAGYEDAKKLGEKVDKLMDFIRVSPKLIIVSDINPENVLNYYLQKAEIYRSKDPKSQQKPDDPSELYMMVHYKLKSFLAKCNNVPVPLDFIKIEMAPSVQHKYYQSILSNCSPEEIFVLLDLGSDTIANIRNRNTIIRLLKRGLLKQEDDNIVLMDENFGEFLMANYTRQHKQRLKKEMGATPGHWSGFKYAIILVIAALFIFIFMGNQEFLNNINKLFITIGASIAGLTSLFNLVIKKNT